MVLKQRLEFFYIINYYFKYIELIDTVFLALKKKPLGRCCEHVAPTFETGIDAVLAPPVSFPPCLPSFRDRIALLYAVEREDQRGESSLRVVLIPVSGND